jgi:hypothetical protein
MVSLQVVVAAGSVALGFAFGAVLAWVFRCRSRAKIAGARLDRYVTEHPSAGHDLTPGEHPAHDDGDEPPASVHSGPERRRHPRLDFFGTQWIAPFSGGALPDDAAFCEVRCLNVSTSGFSFATEEKPDFRSIVVRFQVGSAPMYLTARIVDCRPHDGAGELRFRLGCEFTGRLAEEPGPRVAGHVPPDASPALAVVDQAAPLPGPALQEN